MKILLFIFCLVLSFSLSTRLSSSQSQKGCDIFFQPDLSTPKEVHSDKLVERRGIKYEINSQTPFTGCSFEDDLSVVYVNFMRNWKNGKLNGIFKKYYDPSTLLVSGNYKDGKPEGLWEYFDRNGSQTNIYEIKEGKKLSEIVLTYHYNKNQYKTVNLKSRERYKNGEPDGLWESFLENGQLESRGNYINGKEEGLWEWFHDNGQLESRLNYINGKEEGLWEWFHDNGELHFGEYFIDGKLDGLVEYFDKDGNLTKTEEWKNEVFQR